MSKTSVSKSAQQITQNWANGLKQNVAKIQQGVQNVTENPMQKAIAQKDKLLRNFTASINNGRWEAGCNSVSLADWKTKTVAKIASSLPTGVDNAMQKHLKFSTYLKNELDTVLPQVAAMPNNTLEDGINKVRAIVTHMHENPYKQRTGG